MSQPSCADAEPLDQTWRSIEKLADELAATSKEELPERDFYADLLNRSVSALAAVGATVWKRDRRGFRLDQQVNIAETPLADELRRSDHLRLLDTVWDGNDPTKLVLPRSGSDKDGQPANPTGHLLLLCPVRVEGETVSVVEILQRPTTHPDIQAAYLSLLSALCEAASDFHRNSELRSLRTQRSFWEESQQFARRVHGGSNLKQVGYTIANDGRLLIGCDRTSVAVCRGAKCAMLAVSGVERVGRRSATVRLLERLSAMAAATGENMWYEGASKDLPPEFEHLLQPYVDESNVRLLAIIPLGDASGDDSPSAKSAGRKIGVLIVEQFHAEWDERSRERVAVVCGHSEVALTNALQRRSALRRGTEWLLQAGPLTKTFAVTLLAAAIVVVMTCVQVDFEIQASGELSPQNRRDVFVPADGEVQSLAVEHNSAVDEGDVLLEMSSPELDLEYERLLGEKRTTHQKLLAAQSERVRRNVSSTEERRRMATWSAIEKELEEQLDSLQQQIDILDRQLVSLTVGSPMDGRVLTWDVSGLLESRPVARGQVLLTVADVDGPWVLELEIPDHHVNHVLEARRSSRPQLDVSFILKTNPNVTYQGTIDRISTRTITDVDGNAYVKAIVDIDRDVAAPLTSGTAVVAKIRCGRESTGYVWLHDLIDAVRTWILF